MAYRSQTRLTNWARTLPDVIFAIPERYTRDRSRRADVHITLDGGTRIALELRATALHDDDWRDRHADYQRQGIIDVWLWHANLRTPWMCAQVGQPIWQLNLDRRTITAAVGRPHPRRREWYTDTDLTPYAEHLPPCVGDTLIWWTSPWSLFGLGPTGLRIPDSWTDELHRNAERLHAAAERARTAAAMLTEHPQRLPQQQPPGDGHAIRILTPEPTVVTTTTAAGRPTAPAPVAAVQPAPRPPSSENRPAPHPDPWSIPVGGTRCDIWKEKLVVKWIPYGRHPPCDEDERRRTTRRPR